MKLLLVISTIFFTALSCSKSPTISLKNLNGYWEINNVTNANSEEKTYNFNPLIDYFETKDSIGFKTKLKPNLFGRYTGTKQKINYQISFNENKYLITYTTPTSTWTNKLIEASSDQLCIENSNGTRYFYRKYTPIQIDEKN